MKQPLNISIERVEEETFERDGQEETKLVLFPKGSSQGVVLAKTQINQLVEFLGSDDTDDWVGRKVVMFADPDVWFQGKKVGGIRFRAFVPPKPLSEEMGETAF